jgi:hypothetical protein
MLLIHRHEQQSVDESKALTNGTRVYWQGDAADSGIITETSWDAVTIAWNDGQVARVHHGDMREIQLKPDKAAYCVTALRMPAHVSTSSELYFRIDELLRELADPTNFLKITVTTGPDMGNETPCRSPRRRINPPCSD